MLCKKKKCLDTGPDFSFCPYPSSAFSFKDTVMLQSALRGHLFRDSQLKELPEDVLNQVLPTRFHAMHSYQAVLVKHREQCTNKNNKCYFSWILEDSCLVLRLI